MLLKYLFSGGGLHSGNGDHPGNVFLLSCSAHENVDAAFSVFSVECSVQLFPG